MDFFTPRGDKSPALAVAYTPERGCWVSLPQHLAVQFSASALQLPIILSLSIQGSSVQNVFVAWTGAVCEAGCIGIPAPFASSLLLPEGTLVTLSAMSNVPYATSITLEPLSTDDWEVVELNASHIEEQLLNQAAVVSLGQPLPLWVRGQQIQLTVAAIEPPLAASVARLNRGCEVCVAPKVRRQSGSWDITQQQQGTESRPPTSTNSARGELGKGEGFPAINATLRLHTLSGPIAQSLSASNLPASVTRGVISPCTIQRLGLTDGDWIRVEGRNAIGLVACIHGHTGVAPGHLALAPSDIEEHLKQEPFDLIKLTRLTARERDEITEAALTDSLLGNGGPKLQTALNRKTITRFESRPTTPVEEENAKRGIEPTAVMLPGIADVFQSALSQLLPTVAAPLKSVLGKWGAPKSGSILIVGPSGSGKTSLITALCEELKNQPQCLTASHIVCCKDLVVDGGFPTLRSQLGPVFRAAVTQPPAIIVLDDLDVVCPNEAGEGTHGQQAEGEGGGGDPALVNWLCQILDGLAEPRLPLKADGTSTWLPLAVIATAASAASLPLALRRPGRLDTTLSLPAPTPSSRAAMIASGAASRAVVVEATHIATAADAADGYDGRDIETLLDRAVQLAVARQVSTGALSPAADITASDLQGAMHGLTPATFWGVGTKGRGRGDTRLGWQDVGGLEQVKAALQEALELPVRHAKLVSRAPLRLRTGVLLYGPPGCGKTHIVGAAVAAVGMRCITVSGPELLNKYIGASEAAVRDVFRRAAAVSPSVIFFDEFDALAPQRGHDNTGVTDRVVNQLLTELDGVEGLKGVAVLAATSRPDLVDAALLRPGRLDRILYCGFPSHAERIDILQAVARNVVCAKDVDWEALAGATENYSGADLGAVLSEAQLAAAHEVLESSVGEVGSVVRERHLAAALGVVKPSVSQKERIKLDAVYDRFQRGDRGVSRDAADQKVSWA